MERIKPYDVPHKGLRNALSQLSMLAGRTDYADLQETEQLYLLGRDIFGLLSVHAADENEVTLAALDSRCPGCGQEDVEDHEQLHQVQHKLEALLDEIYAGAKQGRDMTEAGAEFYLAFSEFQSVYLEHTAEEERVTQPLLWQHFTDEELIAQRGKIMAKLPPQTLLTWFRFIIPAQSPRERAGLLGGFKKMAPEVYFNQAMSVIKGVLSDREFEVLMVALQANGMNLTAN